MDIRDTVLEVVYSVMPIVVIIVLFQLTIVKFPLDTFIKFLIGTIMVIIGLILFVFGVKVGLQQVGELVGSTLMMKGKLWLILLFGFIIGIAVTVAEPNLQVLGSQVDTVSDGAISKYLLIAVVALGVGIYIALSLLRTILKVPLVYLLIGSYGLAFLLAVFAAPEFVPVAFDSGGVITGPLLVPFVLSLGIGLTAVTNGRRTSSDSFGLVGLAAIGPILAILILGVIFN